MTAATPESIAPRTKYGAKIVLCQPCAARYREQPREHGVDGDRERDDEHRHDPDALPEDRSWPGRPFQPSESTR